MELKVNPEELDHVKDVMIKDADEFDSNIDKLREQIEILKGIWQGQDADMFCKNVGEFFERANGDFQEGDEAFSKELETEVDEYEQNNNN